MKVIKIKIGLEDTTIWYSEKHFKTRVDAIKAAISHLGEILKIYDVK